MAEVNISFDVLLECFSNFLTIMSMKTASLFGSTGKHVQGGKPVQKKLFSSRASVYSAVSTMAHLYSQYVVCGFIQEEHRIHLLLAHFKT